MAPPPRRLRSRPRSRLELRLRLLLASLLPLLAGCCADEAAAPQAAPVQSAPAPMAAASREPVTFLWRVETKDGASSAHLLGSVHLADKRLFPLDPAINAAFEASDVLAVEADVMSPDALKVQQRMLSAGVLPEGQGVEDFVSAEAMETLSAFLDRRGWSLAGFRRYKPLMLMLNLSVLELTRLGFEPRYGLDMEFLKRAKSAGVPVVEMEGLDAQIAMLTGMPMDEQAALLEASLPQLTDSGKMMDRMLEAWMKGDAGAMLAQITEGFDKDSEPMRRAYRRMFSDRNVGMAKKVVEYLASGKRHFVLVGAGHLVGDDGVVALLRAEGLKVTQVPAKAK